MRDYTSIVALGDIMSDVKTHSLLYRFKFPDGNIKEFSIQLDPKTLTFVPAEGNSPPPEWTRLKHFQCDNCPLREETHPHCPIAKNLVPVIETFKNIISYEQADVEIVTESRTYSARTALQNAIGSLIGIHMVTSGCPVMDKLRPMVKTHLPFATLDETVYRAISMYLTAQYFLYKKGKTPDWDLENLVKVYEEIRIVNRCFVKRLASMKMQDASLNAVVILDCFADTATFMITNEMLEEFEDLFQAYLKP